MKVTPVILCGGSGTRLWPLSRREHPKQFVPLINGKNLLSLTIERSVAWSQESALLCVGSATHRFMIKEALSARPASIIIEPAPRNTTAAIAIAALGIARDDPSTVMVVTPADHHIATPGALHATVNRAIAASEDGLVVIGIVPKSASSNYGYILPRALEASECLAVEEFREKPDRKTAERLIEIGALWNAGLVVGRARDIVSAVENHAPEIFKACSASLYDSVSRDGATWLNDTFLSSPSLPFDNAVLERIVGLKVVPYYGEWSDVGSWDEIAKLTTADQAGNRIDGDCLIDGSTDTYVRSHDRLTVAIGLKNAVIVDTPDALLVADASRLPELREVVGDLELKDRPEVKNHRRVTRPWGVYEILAQGRRYQVKRITVLPGARLSLQYHYHRAEHWVVVKGTAKVTHDEKTFLLRENESTFIPIGGVHRLENPGREVLEIIEVQSGSYLEEDDIVRMEDHYGRVPQFTAEK